MIVNFRNWRRFGLFDRFSEGNFLGDVLAVAVVESFVLGDGLAAGLSSSSGMGVSLSFGKSFDESENRSEERV